MAQNQMGVVETEKIESRADQEAKGLLRSADQAGGKQETKHGKLRWARVMGTKRCTSACMDATRIDISAGNCMAAQRQGLQASNAPMSKPGAHSSALLTLPSSARDSTRSSTKPRARPYKPTRAGRPIHILPPLKSCWQTAGGLKPRDFTEASLTIQLQVHIQ